MRLAVWPALLAVALAAGAAAQPSLQFRHLGLADGLTGAAVTSVAADGQGFVWLGTYAGADRFDGTRLRSFVAVSGAGDTYAYALTTGPDGALWAGRDDGLWRRAPGDDAFARVPLGRGEPIGVRALAVEPGTGTLWVGTTGRGLLRVGGGEVRRFSVARGHLASDTVRAVQALAAGGVAVATAGGLSWVGRGRARHDRTLGDVTALAEAGGRLWAGRETGEVVGLDGGPRLAGTGAPVWAMAPSAVQPGRVWVGVRGGGVRVLDAQAGTLGPMPTAEGLPDPFDRAEVLAVAEHDGVLWIGTTRGAYHAAVESPRFTAFRNGPGGPLAVPDVMSVHLSTRDPSAVWAGTVQGGLHRIDRATGRAERWFDAPHPLAVTFAIEETADGTVWLGGRDPTLWRFRPETGTAEPVPLAPDRGGIVAHLAPSHRFPGHLWVGTSEAGLVRFDTRSGRVVRRYDLAPGPGRIPAASVWHTLEADGALWVATDGDGLWRLDLATGRAARVEPSCALGDVLLSLALAPGGPLWIGERAHRLVRLDRDTGDCRAYTPADGLVPESVGHLFADRAGHVWLSTNLGLVRFDPRAEVFTPFSQADGLATSELYWYAGDRSPTGEIAVGGAGGLTVFDPATVSVDDTPAPVVVTGLRVDGRERPVVPGAPLAVELPHRQNDVAFAYAALDLRQPDQTRYRVRLRGASDVWAPAGSETRYPALAPGRYTFEVAATNRDGYWSDPLSVPVRIRPPFWRTVPFWLLVLGALASVGYGAHRYRIAQIQRVEATRRRIADDLHDGIGSKISSVALRLDMVGRSDALPQAARETLATLSSTARSVVGDVRDTVWLVDADHDDLASVLSRMEQFALATLGGRGSVEAPARVPARALSMEARRDLYLLFTEALHNAVRHGDADRVVVRIEAGPGRVGFEVEDGGPGFDPAEVARGRGLATMARRARALGGSVTWSAREGGGTVVRFEARLG
ncbi:sensor histidine kinase [Rubrivirga sp.]|uniref:sensor histidine kinase n=1 Tax=Rubrivirga sp. TaxID=1885344 RepID=UPI003B52D247